MADQRLAIEIQAKDGASSVLKTIGTNAKQMGTDLSGAGKQAKQMGTDLSGAATQATQATKQLDTGLKSTESSMKATSAAGQSFAIGVAALGASFVGFSNQVVTNQQNIATLGRTYGEASVGLQAFAQQIQATTTFSSEAAVQSANTFGTLVRNYGLSVDQVQQLIQVSTDLAATSGLSLEDVSQRVQAAIRGEGESAEALGLTMNQQAIDRENLTLTMSNQEAAQFRLNALMEQTAFSQGAAADQAETASGKTKQLANDVNDAARSFVEMTGPIAGIASGLGSFGLQAGLAATGMIKMAQGAGQAITAVGGLASAGAVGGLAVAAGLAVYGVVKLSDALSDDFYGALHQAQAGTKTLDEAIAHMTLSLGDAALALRFSKSSSGLDQTIEDLKHVEELKQQIALGPQKVDTGNPSADVVASADAYQALQAELAATEAKYGDLTTAAVTANAAELDFADILTHASAGSVLAQQRALELSEAYNAGQISLADYAWNLNYITENYALYDQAALEAQVSTQGYIDYVLQANDVSQSHAQAISDLTEQYGDLGTSTDEAASHFSALWLIVHEGELGTRRAASGLNELGVSAAVAADSTGRLVEPVTGLGEASSRTAADVHDLATEIEHLNKLAEIQTGNAKTVEREYGAMRPTIDAVTEAHDKLRESLAGGTDEMVAYTQQAFDAAKAVDLLSTNAQLFQAAGIHTPALDVAVNLQGGAGAFDAVFGAIKQAQSMSSNIGGAKSWADQLIGDPGTWSELNKLLDDGRITQEQYNAAQDAQISISRDVTNAQEDLLAVQANLAPAMADATRQQAEYIDGLQDLTPKQQQAALGYMDTAESAKAMSLAQLAASSTTDTMKASTTQMIQQAAAADPVLKAMLEDMGLLNAADGTVNFDTNAVDVGQAIVDLTSSIDALIVALGGIPPVHTETNAKDTQGFVDDLTASILGIPDTSTTDLNVNDNASGPIGDVAQALINLDGKSARTQIDNYVNTYQTTIVSTISDGKSSGFLPEANADGGTILPAYAMGGTIGDIPRYAGGGTHAWVGEYGPEMVWLNRGEQVTNTSGSKSRMMAERQGSRGDNKFYGPVTLQVASTDVYGDVSRSAIRRGRP